jgi:hypothetical protein
MIYRLCFCLFLFSSVICYANANNNNLKQTDSTKVDTAFENRAVEAIGNFPECKLAEAYLDSVTKGSRNLQFTIFGTPTKDEPYYEIDVGNTVPDGGDAGHYETYMHFHVYNKKGHVVVKLYDVILDAELTLAEWRKKEEAPKKEGKKYYFFYIDE